MTVASAAYRQTNATFDVVVAGFTITAIPTLTLLLAAVGGIVAAVLGVVLLVLYVIRRRRRSATVMPSAPAVAIPMVAPAVAPSPPTFDSTPFRFCPWCGTPAQGNNFCTHCGNPLGRGP